MEHQKIFLSIKNKPNLNQLHTDTFNAIARTLARTRLHLVDFEKVKRLRNVSRHMAEREYMLLKMGMFDTWEILYHYD